MPLTYMNHFSNLFLLMFCFVMGIGSGEAQSPESVLAKIEVNMQISDIANAGLPIYAHLQDSARRDYVLVISSPSLLQTSQFSYETLDFPQQKPADERYYIALERTRGARQKAGQIALVLYDDGRHILARATEEQAETLALNGFDLELLGDSPLVLDSPTSIIRAIGYNPNVAKIIASVDKNKVYSYTSGITGESPVTISGSPYTIRSRHTRSGEPIQKATQYAYEFMKQWGLNVSFHEWKYSTTTNRNVVATKLGTTKPKEIVLITAHYDCMPSSTTNSPGADDNASGSVGIMMAAEIFSQYKFERTIRFVLFTGEEQGLLGSSVYASKVYQEGETIIAVYNMDMIGWDSLGGPIVRLHTRTSGHPGYAADREIANVFLDVVNLYKINLSPMIVHDGITASDHASFWRKGYPGILAIEDDQSDFCKNYHTSNDKLSTLHLTYLTNYIKASLGTVAHLAFVQQ